MNIIINDGMELNLIQSEFSKLFPYLRLEFFRKSHEEKGAASDFSLKQLAKTLGELRTVRNQDEVTISANMTVNNLEEIFRKTYGLSVQVFRKSGKAWIETTVTNGWTLEEQNKQGEELSIGDKVI